VGLLDWFRKKPRLPAAKLRRPEFQPIGDDLDREIESVAKCIDDSDAFRTRARTVAKRFGADLCDDLKARFHKPTDSPKGFEPEVRGLAGWLSAWQFAIFEILYYLREPALPLIRDVAFGEYDWIQGNAIEVLCRWAAEGMDKDRTLSDLKREMPNMRDSALLYAAGPLVHQAKSRPELAAIVDELMTLEQFRMAVEELQGS